MYYMHANRTTSTATTTTSTATTTTSTATTTNTTTKTPGIKRTFLGNVAGYIKLS